MLSRENAVVAAFIVLALLVLYGLLESRDPPAWVNAAVVLGVGVVAPLVVNGYLDRREA